MTRRPWAYRLTIWIVAFTLRRGITPSDMLTTLAQALPHRDSAYRLAILNDATERNARRARLPRPP